MFFAKKGFETSEFKDFEKLSDELLQETQGELPDVYEFID